MKTLQQDWDWWAYHFRVVHRSQIPSISEWDDDLVEMIIHVLDLQPGDRILDLACGSGNHARRLAARGLDVLGVDIAHSLIAHCRERAIKENLTGIRFEHGDMRALAIENSFNAVLLLSGSFGFFEEATNRDILARMAAALKPGGRLLVDVFDPARMVIRPAQRSWGQYGGGYGLRCTWWEPETCTYVSEFMFIDREGVLNTAAEPERIRIYSVPEWRELLAAVGLEMTHALADTKLPLVAYNRDNNENLVIVGQKQDVDHLVADQGPDVECSG